MTNREILTQWHDAELKHRRASKAVYGQTLYAKMVAEQAAIERFGLGLHLQALRAQYPGHED